MLIKNPKTGVKFLPKNGKFRQPGVSAISCFEMAWLVHHGRIALNMPFEYWFSQIEYNTDIQILPVTAQIGIRAVTLPEHHKDPQDRIIIATALFYDARLLSFDSAFSAYREFRWPLAWA